MTRLIPRPLAVVFVVLPLVLLSLDYLRHPVIWTGCSTTTEVTDDALFASSSIALGTLLGHLITVAFDDLADPKFLAGAEREPYALVTSEFFEDPLRPEQGMMTQAILARLEQLSTEAHDEFVRLLNNPVNLVPGTALSYALALPSGSASSFPVNRIYVVMIQYKAGPRGHANDGRMIRAGLKEVMRRANEDGVRRLLVPSLGVNWLEPGWLTHEDFFPILFESVDTARRPETIRLSLYSNTPSNIRQRAINAINSAWKARCRIAQGKDVLFEQTSRLVLFFLFVCLLVSSFQAPITVKNGVVIASAFIGSAAGGTKMLDDLIPDYGSAAIRLGAHICVLAILAFCYPRLVRASAKDIFPEAERT